MKNLIKKALKLIVISSLLVFSSCDKDLYEDNIKTSSRNISVKNVSLKDLDSVTSNKIKEKISLIKNLKKNQNPQSKFVYNQSFEIYIDTNKGKQIQDEGKLFYTFPIFRKADEDLENILFVPKDSEQFDAYFVKYNIKLDEFHQLSNEEIKNLQPIYTKADFGQVMCIDIIRRITVYSTCPIVHPNDERCPGQTETQVTTFCSYATGSGGSGGTGATGATGGGSGGGGAENGGTPDTTNPGNYIITTPVGPEDDCIRPVGDLNGDCMLSPEELCLLNGYSAEICKCVSEGGNTDTCAEFLEILEEEPEVKLDRFLELQQIIANNPWALIENCIAQNGLSTDSYVALYNHSLPPVCSLKLALLGPDYYNQPLSAGNVPCANIDYYGVEITGLPDFDHNGQDDTSGEIYQAFRNKFTDLASGSKDDFEFSCDVPLNPSNRGYISWEFEANTPNDNILFTSANPLTAILNIEASANGIGSLAADDGAIMVTGYQPRNWTISTISTPYNGTQPFSGNRQWGILLNQAGRLEFYTKAVDVARIGTIFNAASGTSTECQQDTYYDIAEVSWKNMQQEIAAWVNSYGGQANVKPSTAVRVKKAMILPFLKGTETIDQIITNCN